MTKHLITHSNTIYGPKQAQRAYYRNSKMIHVNKISDQKCRPTFFLVKLLFLSGSNAYIKRYFTLLEKLKMYSLLLK